MISIRRPSLPDSSAATIVPHAVRRTGSQDTVPVSMVSTRPSLNRIRCSPGLAAPCSLQAIRWVGFQSFGHSAIMSTLAPALGAAVTTRACRPLASVTSAVGSASAADFAMLAVEDSGTDATTPNRCGACARSCSSRNFPKSKSPACAVTIPADSPNRPPAIDMTILCISSSRQGWKGNGTVARQDFRRVSRA
jgi:hypothetical protein